MAVCNFVKVNYRLRDTYLVIKMALGVPHAHKLAVGGGFGELRKPDVRRWERKMEVSGGMKKRG